MRSRCRRTSAAEGFTLVETVITAALLLVVVAAMLTLFAGIQRSAARQASRSETTDQVRVAMDRMIKDIRQATAINPGATGDYLDIQTYVDGVERNVIYDATGLNLLTRTVEGNTVTLLERMTITTVFLYTPDAVNPSVVSVTIAAKPETFSIDEAEITLTSEARLRNP